MYYLPTIHKDIMYIRVPRVSKEDERNNFRKEVLLKEGFEEETAAMLSVWQWAKGVQEWGVGRWKAVSKYGTKIFRSKTFGSYVKVRKLGRRGSRSMSAVVSTDSCGTKKTSRSFALLKYGEETAVKLANFQSVIYRARNTHSDLLLPYSLVCSMIGEEHIKLFPRLKLRVIDDVQYLHYDHKLDPEIFDNN